MDAGNHWDAGAIPSTMSQLTQLKALILHHNNLSGKHVAKEKHLLAVASKRNE